MSQLRAHHIMAAVYLAVAAAAITALHLTHHSLLSLLSLSLLVTAMFAAIPASVSAAVGTILSGVTAGETLRTERIMPPIGSTIRVDGLEGTVVKHALRHIVLQTSSSTAYPPNTALLNGFELITTPEVPPHVS